MSYINIVPYKYIIFYVSAIIAVAIKGINRRIFLIV
jgi:hypothetical protein